MYSKIEITSDLHEMKIKNNYWQPFIKKYDCQYICELGIYKGDNFLQMILSRPTLAVAVDVWKDNGVHPRSCDDYDQQQFNEQYDYFKKRVSDKPFVQIIRDLTINAAKQFSDNFFDFIFLDADHSFGGCYSDLVYWYPKVRLGKFLAGHDYGQRIRKTFGVYDAVNKFALENNLEVIRFGHSNWMLIKK